MRRPFSKSYQVSVAATEREIAGIQCIKDLCHIKAPKLSVTVRYLGA